MPGLRSNETARFMVGQVQFLEAEAPAGGLGPVFNDSRAWRATAPAATGGSGDRLVTRFGRLTDGLYDPMVEFGGPLIQSQGIGLFNGVNFVGEVVPPQATIVAHRRTTPLFGLGLIDSIPDDAIASRRAGGGREPRDGGRREPDRRPRGDAAVRGPVRLEGPARLALRLRRRRLHQRGRRHDAAPPGRKLPAGQLCPVGRQPGPQQPERRGQQRRPGAGRLHHPSWPLRPGGRSGRRRGRASRSSARSASPTATAPRGSPG